MLDRASTFAHPEIVELLQTRFIPVAIDQAYQRRQQDNEGDYYRRIADQGPRSDFESTTQGLYIAMPGGKLIAYNNNRGPERILRLMQRALEEFDTTEDFRLPDADQPVRVDERYNPVLPEGGLVVRVRAKVLSGYEAPESPWGEIFQNAVSRDNLWLTADEHRGLVQGVIAESLARRIARYHLVDNTRGEPPMWREDEVGVLEMELNGGRLSGRVELSTGNGRRGYEAQLLGEVETSGDRVTRFDVVALGSYWGQGRYTGGAPEGRFPLAVAFTLADGSDTADGVPPQGSRGWLRGYLE